MSQCPKCGSSTFAIEDADVLNSDFPRRQHLECAECHSVLGITDLMFMAQYFERQTKTLNHLVAEIESLKEAVAELQSKNIEGMI
jgi:ribosomal protein S27AE